MSEILSSLSIATSVPGPREGPRDGSAGVLSIRPQAAEGANALRPVDPAMTLRKARVDTARDQPVGPPPTFQINVLEDLRERLRSAPEFEPVTSGGGEGHDDQASGAPAPAARTRPDPAPQSHAYHVTPEADAHDHALDMKV